MYGSVSVFGDRGNEEICLLSGDGQREGSDHGVALMHSWCFFARFGSSLDEAMIMFWIWSWKNLMSPGFWGNVVGWLLVGWLLGLALVECEGQEIGTRPKVQDIGHGGPPSRWLLVPDLPSGKIGFDDLMVRRWLLVLFLFLLSFTEAIIFCCFQQKLRF